MLRRGSDQGVECQTEIAWYTLPRACKTDVECWATLSQHPSSIMLHRLVDHRRVSRGAPTNGVRAPVDHQSAMVVEYRVADEP